MAQSRHVRLFPLLFVFALPISLAQSALRSSPEATPGTAFEVATIKPVSSEGMHENGIHIFENGRLRILGMPLKALVMMAYDVDYWQISGGDAKAIFDIEAKAPENTGYDTRHGFYTIHDPRLRLMLQSLLASRFHLQVRRVVTEGSVLLLERSDKPFLLVATKGVGENYSSGEITATSGSGWALFDVSMKDIARHLSAYIYHRPVIDKTGITGAYDYRSKTIVTSEDMRGPGYMETFLPVLKEVGLRVTPSRGEVDTLLIDHWEAPSEN